MAPEDSARRDESLLQSRASGFGLLSGLLAYALGLGATLALVRSGILGRAGLWDRVGADLSGQLLAHQAAHVPLWNASVHPEMLPVTGLLVLIVGLAGFFAARRASAHGSQAHTRGDSDDERRRRDVAFRAGTTVVTGYLPPAVLASLYLSVGNLSVEGLALVAPTLLAGVVFPAVVGGTGGAIAAILRERTAGETPAEHR